ncbi:hypothetical protein AB0I98_49135 [Streptomyces sp. NPDC050211]|uniref:hypothetical protein n=1 Tax=Streptomyces sp. NPDC050211 TaxID=3154932 RepID=UPI00341B510A
MREFSALFAGLGQRLDELGVPEGQPFLSSPTGEYDVEPNRYFSVWLGSSPWNTQAAHARDLRTFLDFLWFARGEHSWRGTTVDDRAAFEWWRRRDEYGPQVEDSTWDREVLTVNQFYLWAIEQDLMRSNPIRQRAVAAWSPWSSGAGDYERLVQHSECLITWAAITLGACLPQGRDRS